MRKPKAYKPELPPLGSPASKDLAWYYQCGAAALGMRAISYTPKTPVSLTSSTVGWKSPGEIAAATCFRRIHGALQLIDSDHRAVIELYYTPRQRPGETFLFYGSLVNLVWESALAHQGFAISKQNDFEHWMVQVANSDHVKCPPRTGAGGKPLRDVLRDEAERALTEAIAAYARVRAKPTSEERALDKVEKMKRTSELSRTYAR